MALHPLPIFVPAITIPRDLFAAIPTSLRQVWANPSVLAISLDINGESLTKATWENPPVIHVEDGHHGIAEVEGIGAVRALDNTSLNDALLDLLFSLRHGAIEANAINEVWLILSQATSVQTRLQLFFTPYGMGLRYDWRWYNLPDNTHNLVKLYDQGLADPALLAKQAQATEPNTPTGMLGGLLMCNRATTAHAELARAKDAPAFAALWERLLFTGTSAPCPFTVHPYAWKNT